MYKLIEKEDFVELTGEHIHIYANYDLTTKNIFVTLIGEMAEMSFLMRKGDVQTFLNFKPKYIKVKKEVPTNTIGLEIWTW